VIKKTKESILSIPLFFYLYRDSYILLSHINSLILKAQLPADSDKVLYELFQPQQFEEV